MTAQKQSALQTIEEKKSLIVGIADKVWEFAELSLQEFKSAETYCEALEKEGFDKACVDKYLAMFEEITNDVQGVRYVKEKLEGVLEPEYADGLELIMNSVDAVKAADFKIAFDPTLVRGMSYYTGPIFEISMDEFGGSVGGGGRYDEMIGKFTGNNTCAC